MGNPYGHGMQYAAISPRRAAWAMRVGAARPVCRRTIVGAVRDNANMRSAHGGRNPNLVPCVYPKTKAFATDSFFTREPVPAFFQVAKRRVVGGFLLTNPHPVWDLQGLYFGATAAVQRQNGDFSVGIIHVLLLLRLKILLLLVVHFTLAWVLTVFCTY